MTIGVLFVCTGNTCRSPTAEGVLRTLAERDGLASQLRIDSAGTYPGHAGEPPSRQARISAGKRGYDISALRARTVQRADLADFDYVIALDRGHVSALHQLAEGEQRSKVRLLLHFAPELTLHDIPDPWYGGPADYEHALDLIEAGCRGLLQHLRASHFTT